MRDTDKDWISLARTEPYWSVLSVDHFRGSSLSPDRQNEFFETGTAYVQSLLGLVNTHFPNRREFRRALDFGCGVGRLVIPLSRYAHEVVGVDIAPAMLDLCRQNCAQAGVNNVSLALSDDTLSHVSGTFDVVNSVIVLQHIPPTRGMQVLETLLARTSIGGIFALQMTYARARKFLVHEGPHAKYYRRQGDSMVDILPSRSGPPEGTITMFDYDLNAVMALVQERAGSPILALPTSDDDHLGIQIVGLRAR